MGTQGGVTSRERRRRKRQRERAQPLNTRQQHAVQREGEAQREPADFWGEAKGNLRRRGYELKGNTGRGRVRVSYPVKFTVKVENQPTQTLLSP